MERTTLFGIRHHGPGCARSLRTALQQLQPDCVLIEGPDGAETLLTHLADAELQPPVALLSHAVDDPRLAVFHPYAVFSPEWQALQWATQANVPVRFIDVPASLSLGWQQEDRQADAPEQSGAASDDADDGDAPAGIDDATHEADDEDAQPLGDVDTPHDPLDWLARAAGYGDGESWWNHMVEERGDGEGLFEAIAHAMTELRTHAPRRPRADQAREDIREAWMRSAIREAGKQDFQRIAVICGAWHVLALAAPTTAAADARLLRKLPKLKVQTTWVPWTYRHLSSASGYGAGIDAPGWYAHLWQHGHDPRTRTVAWYARVASLLREHGLDCSSAHLIESARLADALAAMRERPAAGLQEISDATRSVICNGDDTPMQLIAERLLIGDALGQVPSSVPAVPLQRDLEAQQKRLRLKPEALSRTLDLDLRNDTDLQRSHLLHRLALLDIDWGEIASSGRSARGTFHEVWTLAWKPGFQIELIVASRHGQTLHDAATHKAIEQARAATSLPPLAELIDRVLLADLPGAANVVAGELQDRAAVDTDPLALLGTLPALANVHRYGNVRRTDAAQVQQLFDSIVLRACIGVALALCDLDERAAESARETVLAADRAIALRQGQAQTQDWHRALRLAARSDSTAPLLRGLCTRLLSDSAAIDEADTLQQLQRNLSAGAEPLAAAQWLDSFLNRNATVLLHGDAIWMLIDGWLSGLGDEHFLSIVPLVRRSFAQFEAIDRRDLGARVKQGAIDTPAPKASAPEWNQARALRALPMLRDLFGLSDAP